MDEPSTHHYLTPYREAVAKYGPGFEATLWGNRETQMLRFDVMIDLVGFDDAVILDAGCGVGDFATHLIHRNIRFKRFVGLDALAELITEAQSRNLQHCRFEVRDFVDDAEALGFGEPDYVCFSGSLNTLDEHVAQRLIESAFHHAAQGVVFNFLSDRCHGRWVDRDLTPARRFQTAAWIDWAMTLSSRVSFTQEYLDGHDATILIRHDGATPSDSKTTNLKTG